MKDRLYPAAFDAASAAAMASDIQSTISPSFGGNNTAAGTCKQRDVQRMNDVTDYC
jgi:hypothetical protein